MKTNPALYRCAGPSLGRLVGARSDHLSASVPCKNPVAPTTKYLLGSGAIDKPEVALVPVWGAGGEIDESGREGCVVPRER